MSDRNLGVLAIDLAERSIFEWDKPGDYLVLSDKRQNEALAGSRPLCQSELRALFESPRTLRRMLFLEAQRMSRMDWWQECQGELLAANTDDASGTIDIPPGFSLAVREVSTGFELELKLNAEWVHAEKAKITRWRLLAGDRILLEGALDSDGCLVGEWSEDESPMALLGEAKVSVEPANA